jgi:hypothetical protein
VFAVLAVGLALIVVARWQESNLESFASAPFDPRLATASSHGGLTTKTRRRT